MWVNSLEQLSLGGFRLVLLQEAKHEDRGVKDSLGILEFPHELERFIGGICSQRFEYIKSLNEVHSSFTQFNPRHHAMLTTQSVGQVTLRQARLHPQRTDVFAKDLGALAMDWLFHARFLPAKLLASKMRASILEHQTPF